MNPLKKIPSDLLAKSFRRVYLTSQSEKMDFAKSKRVINAALAGSSKKYSSFVAFKGEEKVAGSDAISYSYNETKHFVNGSWDLVSSLREAAPYSAKRYDLGAVRITVDMELKLCTETVPVLLSLFTAVYSHTLRWTASVCELQLQGPQMKNSKAPWQKNGLSSQSFQVEYCDDMMMVTRQVSDKYSEPDLYALWKRKKDAVWIKY
mmetsp:Transcript_22862/g.31352  ORF Transcript_22862/g.31352 Transcript_22862/m.31352 type:complete len:206 (-) Transcript_22862:123-740(-)